MTFSQVVTLGTSFLLLSAALASDRSLPSDSSAEWMPVPAESLAIPAGSPLDLSALVPSHPAGSNGALKVADGHLLLGDRTDTRFNCAMMANGPNLDLNQMMPDHAGADALAIQLRRHGYNLVRIHFLDRYVKAGAKADFAVDADRMDRFHYLLAALKRNGIYWMLDMLTAYDGLRVGDPMSRSINNLKVRINFDPAAQEEWLRIVDTLYSLKNPYTGTSPLDDPALAFVVGVNENSLAFWGGVNGGGAFPAGLAQRFDTWVRKRYSDPQSLRAAIPDLTNAELTGSAPVAPPADWSTAGPRNTQFRAFTSALETRSYAWMTDELRRRGFQGPVLGFHDWYKSIDNRTRSTLPIIDVHAYVGEVTSYATGSAIRVPSGMDNDGLSPLLLNASARWLDRPLVVTEYSTPYPNPFRYESGLMFPAIAAFQSFGTICRMADVSTEATMPSPAPGQKTLYPYRVGVDPVARVAETLSTLLFYRGDIRQADKGAVVVPFGEQEMARAGSAILPLEIRRAALLARFGLLSPDKVAALAGPKVVAPADSAPYGAAAKLVDKATDLITGNGAERQIKLVYALMANGMLPTGNRTDPAKGIYQSQTGEMMLDQNQGTFIIHTPRSEAVSGKNALTDIHIGTLTVARTDKGGVVAASALDGQPLAQSHKILLMLAGDAHASAFEMAGQGTNRTVVNWGKNPVLLQRVKADISLRKPSAAPSRFSVLDLSGRAIFTKDAPVKGGQISLTLDTGAVTGNPTTFFLLEQ